MQQDLGLVECGGCRRDLLGERTAAAWPRDPLGNADPKPPHPFVAGRITEGARSVPYCSACLTVRQAPTRTDPSYQNDQSPWLQNAVRAMEDGE